MEILKRAKGDSGEIVSKNESEANVKEEVTHRIAKAGYCRSSGRIISMPANDKYRKEYRRIFGHN